MNILYIYTHILIFLISNFIFLLISNFRHKLSNVRFYILHIHISLYIQIIFIIFHSMNH